MADGLSVAVNTESNHGSVLIEFIVLAPIVLFIVGFGLRLTQVLQAYQIAMVLSREAATEGYRKCADVTVQAVDRPAGCSEDLCVDQNTSAQVIQACLSTIRDKYLNYWPSMRPSGTTAATDLDLDLEVYRHNFSSVAIELNCSNITNNTSTKITPDGVFPGELPPSMDFTSLSLCRRNRVVRARVGFQLNPSEVFLRIIPGLAVNAVNVADETVL
jgi:hypothetical protein